MNQNKSLRIVPNTDRVLVKNLSPKELTIGSSGIVMAGQLVAGENLYIGQVVHGGDTKFKPGQIIYYSEYSAAALYDLGSFLRDEKNWIETTKDPYVIVAQDDIMAFEELDKDGNVVDAEKLIEKAKEVMVHKEPSPIIKPNEGGDLPK